MIAAWIALGALGMLVAIVIGVAVVYYSALLGPSVPGILKGPK